MSTDMEYRIQLAQARAASSEADARLLEVMSGCEPWEAVPWNAYIDHIVAGVRLACAQLLMDTTRYRPELRQHAIRARSMFIEAADREIAFYESCKDKEEEKDQ